MTQISENFILDEEEIVSDAGDKFICVTDSENIPNYGMNEVYSLLKCVGKERILLGYFPSVREIENYIENRCLTI